VLLAALLLLLLFAAPASADRSAPPPWFVDATNELQARGARCALLNDRWFPRPGQEQWVVGETCVHPLPPALRSAHGRSEACWSQAVQNLKGPGGEGSAYLCSLLANPAGATSWRCGRISVNHARRVRDDTAWSADGGRGFGPMTFPTLRACLAPRVRLESTSALTVTCSHACEVRVAVTARGSSRELAAVRAAPPAGARRELALPRSLPAAVTLRVRVASGRVLRQLRLGARWTGTALILAPTTIRLG
jgi:hypothetical protein